MAMIIIVGAILILLVAVLVGDRVLKYFRVDEAREQASKEVNDAVRLLRAEEQVAKGLPSFKKKDVEKARKRIKRTVSI